MLTLLLRDARKTLISTSLMHSLKTTYKDVIQGYLDNLSDIHRALTSLKDSYEHGLRFYQSIQYILTSPKMQQYDGKSQ